MKKQNQREQDTGDFGFFKVDLGVTDGGIEIGLSQSPKYTQIHPEMPQPPGWRGGLA